MKDRIFLIWSGSDQTAQRVKSILENEYSYVCFVGGSYENNTQTISVGDTVIRQMKLCNQAIVIFRNKADGAVSDNLYFELGYVLATYGSRKIHCVRRKNEAIALPSDFDNSFVEEIDADTEEDFARKIVEFFISRQRLSVDTNKMYLINNRYLMHDMIQLHYSESGSRCSDYELAQYVLFYMQAAVMFQDDEKILNELRDFKRRYHPQFSLELNQAVNLSMALLEVQVNLVTEDTRVYLTDDGFRMYFNACKGILDEIPEDNAGTFDEWAKLISSENLAYACALYAENPGLAPNLVQTLYKRTIEYGRKCLGYIEDLEQFPSIVENNDQHGLISVFRSYIFRHLFNASRHVDQEKAADWCQASLDERRALLRNFDKGSVDSKIYSNFQMEYYLSLMEYIDYVGADAIDPFDYMMYLNDIDQFISQYETGSMHAYIRKIAAQREHLAEE